MPLTKATQAVIAPNICTTDTAQTITGEKTFTQAIIADLTGDVTGDLTGNVTGDLTGDVTGDVTATSVSTTNLVNGSSLCFRNKIINGNFDIWQRGTSLGSASGTRFLADRWTNDSIGSQAAITRQPFILGQTSVPNEPSYFSRSVVTSVPGNANYSALIQRIESVKTLAGKTATLSFYAKADSNKPISITGYQYFGTGGTPSPDVLSFAQKINLTSSWQKFTYTFNAQSISGKTIGSDNDGYFQIVFYFDAGSNLNPVTDSLGQQSGTFDIAQVQLEEGSVATPFENRPIGTELALCQRYYEKSYNIDIIPASVTSTGIAFGSRQTGGGVAYVKFSTTKRATPAVNIWSVTGASGQVRNAAINADEIGTVQDASQSGFNVFPTTSTISQAYAFQWVAQSEL